MPSKKRILLSVPVLLTCGLFLCCRQMQEYDLAIMNVKVFDSANKKVLEARTILISGDTIAAILSADGKFVSKTTIQGNGKLVTPDFVDTHIHLADIFGIIRLLRSSSIMIP